MSDRKIYSGGMGNLIDLALKNGNLALALKLSDVLIAEGGKVTKKQFKQMIMLSKKSGDDNHEGMFACVRIGSKFKYLSAEMLKRHVFPSLDTWPELTIAQLEEFGLSRTETVTAMIEYLVGKGETEAASTVAGNIGFLYRGGRGLYNVKNRNISIRKQHIILYLRGRGGFRKLPVSKLLD